MQDKIQWEQWFLLQNKYFRLRLFTCVTANERQSNQSGKWNDAEKWNQTSKNGVEKTNKTQTRNKWCVTQRRCIFHHTTGVIAKSTSSAMHATRGKIWKPISTYSPLLRFQLISNINWWWMVKELEESISLKPTILFSRCHLMWKLCCNRSGANRFICRESTWHSANTDCRRDFLVHRCDLKVLSNYSLTTSLKMTRLYVVRLPLAFSLSELRSVGFKLHFRFWNKIQSQWTKAAARESFTLKSWWLSLKIQTNSGHPVKLISLKQRSSEHTFIPKSN